MKNKRKFIVLLLAVLLLSQLMAVSALGADSYAVNYVIQGTGTGVATQSITPGEASQAPSYSTDAQEIDYWFYMDSSGTRQTLAVGGTFVPTADTTVVGVLKNKPVIYAVTFTLQGSGTVVDTQSVTAGNSATAPAYSTATQELDSWFYYDANGTKQTLAAGGTFVPTANTTVVGVLKDKVTYTVTFDAATNGGTCSVASLKTDVAGKLASLPTAAKSGYIFSGWYSAASGGTKASLSDTYTTAVTLYAQFTASSSPSTGDSDGLWIWAVLALLSLGALVVMIPACQKNGKHHQ